MTSGRGADDSLQISELAEIDPSLGEREAEKWIGEHLTELRKSVSERRIRNQTLWLVLVIGLVGYVVGYWLRVSVSGEPWASWPTSSTRWGLPSGPAWWSWSWSRSSPGRRSARSPARWTRMKR